MEHSVSLKNIETRESRQALYTKAELEVALAEKELKQWRQNTTMDVSSSMAIPRLKDISSMFPSNTSFTSTNSSKIINRHSTTQSDIQSELARLRNTLQSQKSSEEILRSNFDSTIQKYRATVESLTEEVNKQNKNPNVFSFGPGKQTTDRGFMDRPMTQDDILTKDNQKEKKRRPLKPRKDKSNKSSPQKKQSGRKSPTLKAPRTRQSTKAKLNVTEKQDTLQNNVQTISRDYKTFKTEIMRRQRHMKKKFDSTINVVQNKYEEKCNKLKQERDSALNMVEKMKNKVTLLTKRLETVKLQVDKF